MESEFNDWELLHDSPESEAKSSREFGDVIQSDYFSINSDKNAAIRGFQVNNEMGFVGNEELRYGSVKNENFDAENESGLPGFEGLEEVGVLSGGLDESEIGSSEFDGGNGLDSVMDKSEFDDKNGLACVMENSEIGSREFDGKSGSNRVLEKSEIVSSEFDGKSGSSRVLVSSEFDGESGLDHVSEKSGIVPSKFDGKSDFDCVSEKSEIVSSEFDGKSCCNRVLEKSDMSEFDGKSGPDCVLENSEIVLSEFDDKSDSEHVSEKNEIVPSGINGKSGSDGESVKSDKGGDVGDKETTQGEVVEKRRVVWWKIPLDFLKYCAFKFNPVLSFSVAATLMGVVILGRRLYKMKRKSRLLELKVVVDDKNVSQFMNRAARLNEAFSIVRRVPVICPSLPASGVAPWPAMSLR